MPASSAASTLRREVWSHGYRGRSFLAHLILNGNKSG